ncbi:hypothetical protein E2562_003218, partial [Oryza meyeriana var. granulata]
LFLVESPFTMDEAFIRMVLKSSSTNNQNAGWTKIPGAKVKVECRSKSTGAKTCSFEGQTDHTGTYNIPVDDEHEHELCESVLVSSPDAKCGKIVTGRERAPVFLTNNNGVTSNVRLANALGFQKDAPLAACAQILKMYEEVDDRERRMRQTTKKKAEEHCA